MIDHIGVTALYNNERLVIAAATNPSFLALKSPRCSYVLEALGRVDRRDYLGDIPMEVVITGVEELEQMRTLHERMNALTGSKVVYSGREREIKNLATQFSEAVAKLLREGIQTFAVSPAGLAYNDCTLPIGYEQSCSKPSLVAFMNDILEIKEGQNMLEIGTGCGYHAAVTLEQLEKAEGSLR